MSTSTNAILISMYETPDSVLFIRPSPISSSKHFFRSNIYPQIPSISSHESEYTRERIPLKLALSKWSFFFSVMDMDKKSAHTKKNGGWEFGEENGGGGCGCPSTFCLCGGEGDMGFPSFLHLPLCIGLRVLLYLLA